MAKKSLLLAKFGKREHLKLLKDGQVYFSPIQKYRDDGTIFRGDKMEGIIPIDPSTISIKDQHGKDIFRNIGLPYPTSVCEQIVDDENTFIFCAAMITQKVLTYYKGNNKKLILCDEFKNAIKCFGKYVLLFNLEELLSHLDIARQRDNSWNFMEWPIIYTDINDFSKSSNYYKAYNLTGSVYGRYFVKDKSYEMQNEWRLIVDGTKESLKANYGQGFCIDIGKLDYAYLYDTDSFLDTLQLIEE